MTYLDSIECPEDIKKLSESELLALTDEMRQALYQSLNQSGGHFGANLGTVELTVALHYVFSTPDDDILWDVGHQAYPHKMLTGRKDQMHTIRQKEGLAPFPRREESPHDAFGVGHSSTSISAGLGMAMAKKINNDDSKVVAVIGDGAMTAGMAFEALNHGGMLKENLLVILNDNDMSISENVGALSNYFSRILSSKTYSSVKQGSKKVLSRIPPVWELARRTESHLKGMVAPGTLFEELGFNYIGPIDGHDLPQLIKMLKNIKALQGPQLLHVITQKGKGYDKAEADPIGYHAVNKGFYDKDCGNEVASTPNAAPKPPTFSKVFGDWLCDMAKEDEKLIGITPAMREGSGMVEFSKAFPERYVDVGIAEQHSVTLAAGLACEKTKPVVAIYSTFLQRAYDQLVHDVAIQNLNVLFAIDRAGLVGDGPTHGGFFDLSYLRCIPNMMIMAPSSAKECRQMLSTGFHYTGPAAVRYPRGQAPDFITSTELDTLPIGKANVVRQGTGLAICAFGTFLDRALIVGEQINATVVDMRFVKPLDEALLKELTQTHNTIVTLEENVIAGGAGSAVNEFMAQEGLNVRMLNLGLPDYFMEHGDREAMLKTVGLSAEGILHTLEQKLGLQTCKPPAKSVESV